MRRKDREITDCTKIEQIIASCHCCRIGFYDEGQIYIVPLNFGYVFENEQFVFYFHSAKEGRKVDLIKSSPHVGFELDTNYKLHEADTACDHSAQFQSIIGTGVVNIVESPEEKKNGLLTMMKQNTGKGDWSFSDQMLNAVCVFKLTVDSISCKEHL